MIELIHRHPMLIKVLLAVVTLSFVLTGGWILGKEEVTDYAAKVGSEKITMTKYDDALSRMQEFYRKMYQGNVPENVMSGLGKRAIEALVDQKLLVEEAKKQGLSVTDQELSEAVTGNKSFQDESGKFSQARYVNVLQANGMTPALYERELRDELLTDKFRKLIKDSVYVSEDDVRDYYKAQLAVSKKPFDEKEFQAQKGNLARMVTLIMQERQMESFMDGLRKSYTVEINPSILKAS